MFWNASTGRFYEQRDSLSPFQSVGALVNEENVWFNIQADEAPARVRFDVSSFSNNERRRDSFQGWPIVHFVQGEGANSGGISFYQGQLEAREKTFSSKQLIGKCQISISRGELPPSPSPSDAHSY